MSVKNIFFTDDNQLDFKIGDEDVSKIFCGDVLVWERGEDYGNRDRIEYVKGFTSPVNGTLKNTYYESGDISDECEIYQVTSTSGTSYAKPKSDCLAIYAAFMSSNEYTNNLSAIQREGWNLVDAITMGASPNTYVLAVFSRSSNGSLVYGRLINTISTITLLYGAKSVSVVESGNPTMDTTYSYQYSGNVSRSLYGFSTAAPTTKKRLYICSRCLFNSDDANLCSDKTQLPVISALPDEYTFTLSNGNGGVTPRVRVSYDNTNDNGGLVWFVQYKDNPPSSFTPLDLSYFSTLVLDINYD